MIQIPVHKPRLAWLYPKIEKPMGGTNFVLYAAAALSADFEVTVAAQKTAPIMVEAFAERGVKLVDLRAPSFTDVSFWLTYSRAVSSAARTLRPLIETADVVISSMYPMNVIADLCGRNDLQILYEPFTPFHDPAFLADQPALRRLFLLCMRRLHKAQEVRATQAAGDLLTLSDFERQAIQRTYGRDAAVIYEGVDTGVFSPEAEPLPGYEGRTVVLHSTGFDRFKGTDTVIAGVPGLVRRIPSVLILITETRADAAAVRRYRRFLRAEGVEGHVRFLGRTPFAQLPRLYRTATVYVEPGSDRSMSLSVKEAMACGTPVVRGLEGGEEITDGVEGFLVSAKDVDGFVSRVETICTQRDLRQRMSAAAVDKIARQFTWSAVAGRLKSRIDLRLAVTLEMNER